MQYNFDKVLFCIRMRSQYAANMSDDELRELFDYVLDTYTCFIRKFSYKFAHTVICLLMCVMLAHAYNPSAAGPLSGATEYSISVSYAVSAPPDWSDAFFQGAGACGQELYRLIRANSITLHKGGLSKCCPPYRY